MKRCRAQDNDSIGDADLGVGRIGGASTQTLHNPYNRLPGSNVCNAFSWRQAVVAREQLRVEDVLRVNGAMDMGELRVISTECSENLEPFGSK